MQDKYLLETAAKIIKHLEKNPNNRIWISSKGPVIKTLIYKQVEGGLIAYETCTSKEFKEASKLTVPVVWKNVPLTLDVLYELVKEGIKEGTIVESTPEALLDIRKALGDIQEKLAALDELAKL